MPITAKGDDLQKFIEECARTLRAVILRIVIEEATEAVDKIKLFVEGGGYRRYEDQTGNLTSSIGFVVVDNGTIVTEYGFEPIKPTATEGPAEGRSYAAQLVANYSQGIVAIIVAGMNYAAYVEKRGLGGMTAGEQALRNAIHEEMLNLQKQLKTKLK
jgi:hypothetical protein